MGHDLLLLPSVTVLPVNLEGRVLLVHQAEFRAWGTISPDPPSGFREGRCASLKTISGAGGGFWAMNARTTVHRTNPALGVWPARVGELEFSRRRDDEFANRYREWRTAARQRIGSITPMTS
ncbi:hypothetical protein ACOJ08_13395 [Ornithinimicrobium sp. Y1847]|uniref:hypothetical protein n=1 Tax=Ornithinimicrobium sp. Y1847 TaxID=3405419 RepID=UPI003B6707E5